MKLLSFSLVALIFFKSSAQSSFQGAGIDTRGTEAQVRDLAAEVRANNNMERKPAKYDTLFKDYTKTFYVSKAEIKDRNRLDSIFNLAKYYLKEAMDGGYHRIIMYVQTKGFFYKYRERIFYCDKLFEELTGKKLIRQYRVSHLP